MSRQPNGMMNPTIMVRCQNSHPYETLTAEYRNLKELRSDMMFQLSRSADGEIHVARSRRGEWGEWFEVWDLCAGKPRLLREGWM